MYHSLIYHFLNFYGVGRARVLYDMILIVYDRGWPKVLPLLLLEFVYKVTDRRVDPQGRGQKLVCLLPFFFILGGGGGLDKE